MGFQTTRLLQPLFAFTRVLLPAYGQLRGAEAVRAENLVMAFVLALVVIPAYVVFYHALSDDRVAFGLALGIPGVLASAALLRLSGRVWLARDVFITVIYALLVFQIYLVGGTESPSVIWLAVCPLVATSSGGIGAGLAWVAVTMGSIAAVYFLALQGVFPPVQVDDMRLLGVVSRLSFVVLVAVFMLIYERIASTAISGLNKALGTIQDLAVHDELTGVFNRRELFRFMEQERARAERYGTAYTLCLIDVDHFKQINDSYGHMAGDQALRRIAATLRLEIRESDCIGRYGGEEFLLILAGIEIRGAAEFADRIRRVIETIDMPELDGRRLTISAGVAEARSGETIAQTLARADAALYCAKAEGRNRVIMAEV